MPRKTPKVMLRRPTGSARIPVGKSRTPLHLALMELAAKVKNASGEIEAMQDEIVHGIRSGRENVEQNLSSVCAMMDDAEKEMRTTAEDLKLILFDEMRKMGDWTEREIEECRRAYVRLEESGLAMKRLIDGDPVGSLEGLDIAIEAYERLDAIFTGKSRFAAAAEPSAVTDLTERLVSLLWSTWTLHTTAASSGNLTEEDIDLFSPVSPEAFWATPLQQTVPFVETSSSSTGDPSRCPAQTREDQYEEAISWNPPPPRPPETEGGSRQWLRSSLNAPINEWMRALTMHLLASVPNRGADLVERYRGELQRDPQMNWVQHRGLLVREFELTDRTIDDLEEIARNNEQAGTIPAHQRGDDHSVGLVGDRESVLKDLGRFTRRVFSLDFWTGKIVEKTFTMLNDRVHTHGWIYVATNVMMTPVWWMLLYNFVPVSAVLSWLTNTGSALDPQPHMDRIQEVLSTEHCVVSVEGRTVCGAELDGLLNEAVSNMTSVHEEFGGELAKLGAEYSEIGRLFDRIIPSLQTSFQKMNDLVSGLREVVSGAFSPDLPKKFAFAANIPVSCNATSMRDNLVHLPSMETMSEECRGYMSALRAFIVDQMKSGYMSEVQETIGDVSRAAQLLRDTGSTLTSWTLETQEKISSAMKVILQMVPLDFKDIAKELGMPEGVSLAHINEALRRMGARIGRDVVMGRTPPIIKRELLTRLPRDQYEMFSHAVYTSAWNASLNLAAEALLYDKMMRLISGGIFGSLWRLTQEQFIKRFRTQMPELYKATIGGTSGVIGATFGHSVRLARNLRILLDPLSTEGLGLAEARAGMGRTEALREVALLMTAKGPPTLGLFNIIRDTVMRISSLGNEALGQPIRVYFTRRRMPTHQEAMDAVGHQYPRRANSLRRGIAYCCNDILRGALILRRAGMRTRGFGGRLGYTASWQSHVFRIYKTNPEDLPIRGHIETMSAQFVAGVISSMVNVGRVPVDVVSALLWPFSLLHVMNAFQQTALTLTSANWAYGTLSLAGFGYSIWAQPHESPRENTRPLLGFLSSTIMPTTETVRLGGAGLRWYAYRCLGVAAITIAIMKLFPNTVFDVGLPFSGIESALEGLEDFSASVRETDKIMQIIMGMRDDAVWRVIWQGAVPAGLQAFVALGGPCLFFPFWNHLRGTAMAMVFGAFARAIGWGNQAGGQAAGLLAAMFFYGLNVGAQLHIVLPQFRDWIRRGGARRVVWGTVTPIARAFRSGIGRLFGCDAASSEAIDEDMTILGLFLLSRMYEDVLPDRFIEGSPS